MNGGGPPVWCNRWAVNRLALPLVVLLMAAAAGAQQILSRRIVLATVTDTGNRPLFDLGPDDFVVDEHGEPRNVLAVNVADYPIAVLIDTSAQTSELAAIRAAAVRFIERTGERPIVVASLAAPATLVAPADSDRATVLAKVEGLTPAQGPPLPLEAAAMAARGLQETGAPFSAMVIISAEDANADRSDGKLLTPILDSGATIHVVARRPAGNAPGSSADLLRGLAEQTHGQYTTIYSTVSYSIALDRLADRLATEMMIQYMIPAGTKTGGDVRVGVKIPGARVRGLGLK